MAVGQPLRGFVAQGMSGGRRSPKILAVYAYETAGAFSFTNGASPALAEVWLFGAGGGGDSGVHGGGSGAALYLKFPVGSGQTVTGAVGAGGVGDTVPAPDGGDTTITTLSGSLATAGGGKGSTGAPGAAGGTATGGDINLPGGAAVLTAGGAAPSFTGMGNFLAGAAGGTGVGSNGSAPGGGGGAQGNGAVGRAVIVLWRKPG